jgi:hypothetical protein
VGAGGPSTSAAAGGGAGPKHKKSKVQELMEKEMQAKARASTAASTRPPPVPIQPKGRIDHWLHPGIVVKVMSKALRDHGYYKQKVRAACSPWALGLWHCISACTPHCERLVCVDAASAMHQRRAGAKGGAVRGIGRCWPVAGCIWWGGMRVVTLRLCHVTNHRYLPWRCTTWHHDGVAPCRG